jgi:hypothetical protein
LNLYKSQAAYKWMNSGPNIALLNQLNKIAF